MKLAVRLDVSCPAQFGADYREVALKIMSAQHAEIIAAILRMFFWAA